MEFVRGPSWLPLRLSLYLQIACVLAILLAESIWCIVVAAAYLVDPDVGAERLTIALLPIEAVPQLLPEPVKTSVTPLPLRVALPATDRFPPLK